MTHASFFSGKGGFDLAAEWPKRYLKQKIIGYNTTIMTAEEKVKEEAAREWAGSKPAFVQKGITIEVAAGFLAGAEWQDGQSGWRLISELEATDKEVVSLTKTGNCNIHKNGFHKDDIEFFKSEGYYTHFLILPEKPLK